MILTIEMSHNHFNSLWRSRNDVVYCHNNRHNIYIYITRMSTFNFASLVHWVHDNMLLSTTLQISYSVDELQLNIYVTSNNVGLVRFFSDDVRVGRGPPSHREKEKVSSHHLPLCSINTLLAFNLVHCRFAWCPWLDRTPAVHTEHQPQLSPLL